MIIMYLFPVAIGFTMFMLRLLDLKYEMKKNYFKKIANTKFAYYTIRNISIVVLCVVVLTNFYISLNIMMDYVLGSMIATIAFMILIIVAWLYPRQQTWEDVYQIYINPPENMDNLTSEQKKYMHSISRLQAFLILALAILNALVFYKNTKDIASQSLKIHSSCYNEKEQMKW